MNVQRGASAVPAAAPVVGPHQSPRRQRKALSLVQNSLALIAAKFATLGLGFVFWLLAARLFARTEMGAAAAVVSAVMLCTQLALLGVGSSVITLLRDHQEEPERLIHSALAVVAVAAAVGAVVFVAFVGLAAPSLDVVAGSVSYAALFIVAVVCGAIGMLLDQTSTGVRRGDQALARGLVFGLTTIAAVAALASAGAEGSQAIFLAWAVAGPAICVLGSIQLRRLLPGFGWRLSPERRLAEGLVRVGLPNHVLTLAERVPGLALPLIVTVVMSAHANAAWYAAWMMAWAAYVIPVQVGLTAFAEIAREPDRFAAVVGHALRTSLLLGCAAAGGLLLFAQQLLSLMGPGYAADAATALRILALAVFPMCFVYVYFAVCRALRVPQRALAFGWTNVAVTLAAAALAGSAAGLTAIAASWSAVQTAFGLWAAWRLWRLAPSIRPFRRVADAEN
jgi:O-antigen/teichoic acid export membrane protein